MLQKLNAEETLQYLIGVMKENLNELYGELPAGSNRHFIHGEKTAYVECLEIVHWGSIRGSIPFRRQKEK